MTLSILRMARGSGTPCCAPSLSKQTRVVALCLMTGVWQAVSITYATAPRAGIASQFNTLRLVRDGVVTDLHSGLLCAHRQIDSFYLQASFANRTIEKVSANLISGL
jgi:hypothetical protein